MIIGLLRFARKDSPVDTITSNTFHKNIYNLTGIWYIGPKKEGRGLICHGRAKKQS